MATSQNDLYQVGWFAGILAMQLALTVGPRAAEQLLAEIRPQVEEQLDPVIVEGSLLAKRLAGNQRAVLAEMEVEATAIAGFGFRGAGILELAAAAAGELGEIGTATALGDRATVLWAGRDVYYQSRAAHWLEGTIAWNRGDLGRAIERTRLGAERLLAMGALPIAALALRDLADMLGEAGHGPEAAAAEASLAATVDRLDSPFLRSLAEFAAPATVDTLARLGYGDLHARSLAAAGRLEEAAAAFEKLGASRRRDRLLADLARFGPGAGIPGSDHASALPSLRVGGFGGPRAPRRGGGTRLLSDRRGDPPPPPTGSGAGSGRNRGRPPRPLNPGRASTAGPGPAWRAPRRAGSHRDGSPRARCGSNARHDRRLAARGSAARLRPLAAGAGRAAVDAALPAPPAGVGGDRRARARRLRRPGPRALARSGRRRRRRAGVRKSSPSAWRRACSTSFDRPGPLRGWSTRRPAVRRASWSVRRSPRPGYGRRSCTRPPGAQHAGRLVLTYLAVVSEPASAEGFEDGAIGRTELARGGTHGAPAVIDVAQVVEHAMRHLSWLSRDDPVIGPALSREWLAKVAEYHPEPFRSL